MKMPFPMLMMPVIDDHIDLFVGLYDMGYRCGGEPEVEDGWERYRNRMSSHPSVRVMIMDHWSPTKLHIHVVDTDTELYASGISWGQRYTRVNSPAHFLEYMRRHGAGMVKTQAAYDQEVAAAIQELDMPAPVIEVPTTVLQSMSYAVKWSVPTESDDD